VTQTAPYHTDTSDLRIPHGLFRGVFSAAAQIVDGVRPGDAEHVAAVSSYFDNVLRFLDAHHDGEDAIVWPVLLERCPSEATALVARMQGEHDAIHRLRERSSSALVAWIASADAATAQELVAALASLHATLDTHFAEEEADVVPLASRYMSHEEWAGLPAHAMGHFTGDKIWLILGLVLEQMTEEERAATLQLLPPPAVEMWTASGHAAFDDFIGRVRTRSH
jgi:hemerythrin-like domain-containing protein